MARLRRLPRCPDAERGRIEILDGGGHDTIEDKQGNNGDFIVTDTTTGDQVTLNQNFQSGDFGITLKDASTDPATTLTITGDFGNWK